MNHTRWTWLGIGMVALALGVGGSASGCATGDLGLGGSGTTGTTTTATESSTTTTAIGGAGGGAPDICPGSTFCNGICTNLSFDPINCGMCGVTCGNGQVCAAGECAASCSGGTKQCGSVCVDTKFDPKNCGTCGHECAPEQYCSGGACASHCLGGTKECNGKCIDTQTDSANCGACGTPCPAGEVCSAGQCDVVCVGGSELCGNACVDTQNNPLHCGTCNKACPSGQVCSGGQCGLICFGGATKCLTQCVDTKNDPQNCGSCGHLCAPGEACVNGSCGFCTTGFTQCNATCVDEKTDPLNCGGCNVVCQASDVCSLGTCAATCAGSLTACGQKCLDTSTDVKNCGTCGNACASGETCQGGSCVSCNSATTDCDGDGWLVADGDCCDKPGLCGASPELVNPGALEVVGNGIDDNCNGLTDLFDTQDTVACDDAITSNSSDPLDYARALGICRQTVEQPALLQNKTWGLLDAKILRADGTPLQDFNSVSVRTGFGAISPSTTEGKSVVVMSSGVAADGTQTMPGPNGGAPAGFNVSNPHFPSSSVNISAVSQPLSVRDWFAIPNPPLKVANGLPDSPGCNSSSSSTANDSVMLYLRLRAPTNAKAFSFNSYFMSAEYPEFVCTTFNDQFIALVDTPNGTPSPIPNPVDKNLMVYTQGGQQWPIGINIAKGTTLFAVCDSQAANPGCWDPDVSASSCSLGSAQLMGTGFEPGLFDTCTIGGGTFWLTTAGNVIPGDIVELRIAIWDVGDSSFDSLAIIDGFQWLTNATLPGTGG